MEGKTYMLILQIFSIIIWLIFVPYAMGLLPAQLMAERQRTPGVVLLSGYIFMFAVFELIAIPVVINVVYHGLTSLMNWFTAVSLILAAAGIGCEVIAWRRGGKLPGWRNRPGQNMLKQSLPEQSILKQSLPRQKLLPQTGERKIGMEEKIMWILFLLLVGFQLYMAFTRAAFDGDDAYYVVHSLTAQQQDVLYRIEPDTGKSTPLDLRHALAVFPLWIAHIAGRSGIHATIVSHSIVPLVLLPLTYLLYFQIGKSLLGKKRDMQSGNALSESMLPIFMVIMALIQMFGNVSIYTNETFLMMRTWQGKSLAGNFIMPAVLWLFLWIFEEGREKVSDLNGEGEREENQTRGHKQHTAVLWVLLGAVNWMAGMGSSQAAFLCAILTAAFGFFMMVWKRSFWVLVKAGLVCVPNVIYILLYLVLTH